MRIKRRFREDADLDITSFMNLMIILVPVLLMSMVLARTTVLDLKLPDMADSSTPMTDEPPQQLEVIIRADKLVINYPSGVTRQEIGKTSDGEFDYKLLATFLQQIKLTLENQGIQKKDIYILSEKDTDYQTLVSTMDTARSFKAVVATSVVEAELFPEISLGDAPPPGASTGAVAPAAGGAQ
ncbi:ExbD/TolR family protein [Cellvibrio sp. NN19]|uniref:ExbD/TolR family protein n=1 Tax=Cellvibrio chitinivorans TaxID=3102792 RepID=UPI002B40F6AF|nr:biopolymer transporter ExbD [Cellvibrio sp. NN19]